MGAVTARDDVREGFPRIRVPRKRIHIIYIYRGLGTDIQYIHRYISYRYIYFNYILISPVYRREIS